MRTAGVKNHLPVVLICGAAFFTLLSCAKRGQPESISSEQLARTIVERVQRNLECRDFTFRLKITRSYPDGSAYSRTFQFYGVLSQPESKVFAETLSRSGEENSRYLLIFKDKKLISAKMFSSKFGDMETQEDEQDLSKMTFGNLSYPEFRHMVALQASDFDRLSEDAQYFVVHSHVQDRDSDEAQESVTSRFVYYIEKESYLPAKIEFFNQREEFKEFNLEAKELAQGRWVVRRGRVKDFLDQSETLLELEDFHFDQGVDARVFTEHNLRTPR